MGLCCVCFLLLVTTLWLHRKAPTRGYKHRGLDSMMAPLLLIHDLLFTYSNPLLRIHNPLQGVLDYESFQ